MDPQPCTRNNVPETKDSATNDIVKIDPAKEWTLQQWHQQQWTPQQYILQHWNFKQWTPQHWNPRKWTNYQGSLQLWTLQNYTKYNGPCDNELATVASATIHKMDLAKIVSATMYNVSGNIGINNKGLRSMDPATMGLATRDSAPMVL